MLRSYVQPPLCYEHATLHSRPLSALTSLFALGDLYRRNAKVMQRAQKESGTLLGPRPGQGSSPPHTSHIHVWSVARIPFRTVSLGGSVNGPVVGPRGIPSSVSSYAQEENELQ